MFNLDLTKPCHVHFIGIGGISMSGLAKLLLDKGFTVSGSDNNMSELTLSLENAGAKIMYGQKAENITNDIDVVVYTAAIKETNPEYASAAKQGVNLMTRAELLGQIMAGYDTAIGVAGTHGKTTTSSMISEILINADLDPTISLGGMLDSIGGNMRIGKSPLFVTEACEYTNSFLSFNPTVNVILNVEEDHLDFFKDLADIRNSFKLYVERLPKNGTLIINSAIEDIEYFYSESECKVITFGLDKESDYSADDIECNEYGNYSFTLLKKGEAITTITLSVPGIHNVCNALAAIAVAYEEHVSIDIIKSTLLNFKGSHRRFEKKGSFDGVTVIDDYAHHPSEIEATLKGAANYPHKTLWVVFQPHTYTRTKAFLPEFAKALSHADKVVLAPIYAARETDTLGISSKDIAALIKKSGHTAYYFDTFEEIEEFLKKNCTNGDMLITMGAGNVVEIGENLVK